MNILKDKYCKGIIKKWKKITDKFFFQKIERKKEERECEKEKRTYLCNSTKFCIVKHFFKKKQHILIGKKLR